MIEHIYIKNYKAFQKENIPLEEHALLIGTNNSGKTTILEALDLFFNGRIRKDYIKNISQDVKIECFINEKRYRKVYTPPSFDLNPQKSIGDFFELKDLTYLFIPKYLSKQYLMKELLRINMHSQVRVILENTLKKAYDYLDGEIGNKEVMFSRIDLDLEINKADTSHHKEELTKIIKNINHANTILGIDHIEAHFLPSLLHELPKYFLQSIVTTTRDDLIDDYPYHIQALYKEDVKEETDTTLRVTHNQYDKTMLLVEGKYDVAWYEKALKLLGKYQDYRVIPCGGFSNIAHVDEQLKKAGFKTKVITDGDIKGHTSLSKDVIELYADVNYVNNKFYTNFDKMPSSKWHLFRAIHTKDDIVKKVLSSWAKHHLQKESEFVQELSKLLS